MNFGVIESPTAHLKFFATTMSSSKRVCLFGLSADPPTGTTGHVGIARKLASLPAFDEIRVLPVYRHTYAVCPSAKEREQVHYYYNKDCDESSFSTMRFIVSCSDMYSPNACAWQRTKIAWPCVASPLGDSLTRLSRMTNIFLGVAKSKECKSHQQEASS